MLHLSPWFSAACTATIVHRNHFFVCTNIINLLNLKKSSDRLAIIAKRFLKLPNLHMLLKQKSLSLPKNLALPTFNEWFLNKGKFTITLYSVAQRYCLLHLIKQNFLLKTFLRTLILMIWITLYLFFSSQTNLKLHNVSITPKMVKKIIKSVWS